MFSIWMDVLALTHCYEKGMYDGIEVDFKKTGLYYDADHGENWWSYYCEPILLGQQNEHRYVIGDPPGFPGSIENVVSRHQAHTLIKKYIYIKPEVLNIVDTFQKENFLDQPVIGIHYRGTDKVAQEAIRVPFEDVAFKIQSISFAKGWKHAKIFVATDEQAFLDFMIARYGNRVCFQNAERSSDSNPLHLNHASPYQHGLEAMVDMLLLSRASCLIRTSSNLGRWSTYFNPDMPVYELNELHFH